LEADPPNFQAVDLIIEHLKLTFVDDRPPPCHIFEQVALMAASAFGYFRGIGPGYTPTIPKLAESPLITARYKIFSNFDTSNSGKMISP
jgi:hypothetical protein